MSSYQNSSYRGTSRYRKKQGGNEWPHILLFYVLPFLVVNFIIFFAVTAVPKVTIDLADTNDYLSTNATVTVKSWFPTKSVTLSMDNEELTAEKGRKRTYTTAISKNGVLEVTVKNINGMSTTMFEHINILDDIPPSIENTSIQDGIVTLSISDSQSGVNFDSIYALDSQNQRIEPLTVDRTSATLSFEMDSAGLHVFAQDKAGNEVQGTFTSHKEGSQEMLDGGVVEAEEAEETPAESDVSIQ